MADFAAFGMKLIGTAGLYNTVCRIEDTTFQTDRGSARGIQLSAGDATVESVNIERCRFLGPMETGIEFTTDVMRWINVKECLFHQLNTGIAFEVPAPLLDSVVIGNNTFHECGVGVRFQNMPVESTQKIGLVRNLFVSSSQQDVLMSQGYTAEQWANVLMPGAAGSSWNWTTRPAPTGGTAVNIFNNNGRVAVTDVTFQSTDPTTANFLKPADGKGKIAAATGFKPFVGAIAP